ncbi:MAG: F0F1 ATP synthase subunit delta [Burkholderiales bacterium]|nr:F0F1 ATP synthase subunit delta [Burkholderiales bacterium]
MAEIATIARPYAEAAFGLADRSGTLETWSAALGRLAQAAAEDQVRKLIGNPQVTDSQRVELLMAVVAGGSSGTAGEAAGLRNFLAVLAENKRLEALGFIREQFERLKAERETIVDATLESAFELNEMQLADIVAGLERRFARKVRAQVSVVPELIGGARITVGDLVIDGSVRGKLAAMAAGLAAA